MAVIDLERYVDRQLAPSDAAAGLALSDEAGWNQTIEDWGYFLQHGCVFGIRDAEAPAHSQRGTSAIPAGDLDQHGARHIELAPARPCQSPDGALHRDRASAQARALARRDTGGRDGVRADGFH